MQTSMTHDAPPGVPAALRTDPDLWAIALPGETAQERHARYCAAADMAEEYWLTEAHSHSHAHVDADVVDFWGAAA